MRSLPDLTRSELIAASVLTAGTLLIGCFPAPALELTAATAAHLMRSF
jgi:NADH:ubiquinone oxidoreductase subunit 4 (subunit M)